MSLPAPWRSMNRICAFTAIDRPRARRLGRFATALLVLLLAGAGCTPVRPVVKIGLIAPFEGLYRETGYEALAALRAAIETCAPAGIDVLPLALDDSNRPDNARRAAAKLLVDPATAAIIGPYNFDTAIAAGQELTAGRVNLLAPYILGADGRFAAPDGDLGWLADLIAAIAAVAQHEGAQQIAVAGLPPAWLAPLSALLAGSPAPIPVHLLDPDAGALSDPGAHGAYLWLGEAHTGAHRLAELRAMRPDAAFWLGPQGGDPVFTAHAAIQGPVYWATWAGAQYNSVSQPAALSSPAARLTFDAACAALKGMDGESPPPQPRRLEAYRIAQNGESVPLGIESGGP